MTKEKLCARYVELAYVHITRDVESMRDFIWATLNDQVDEMDNDTLEDCIDCYEAQDDEDQPC